VVINPFIAGLLVVAVRSASMVLSFFLGLLLDRGKGLYEAESSNAPSPPISHSILFRENCIAKLTLVI
jgi:hypothetical protein